MLRQLFVLESGPKNERVGAAIELMQTPRMHSRVVTLLISFLCRTTDLGEKTQVGKPALHDIGLEIRGGR